MDLIYRFDPYAPLDFKRPKTNKEALKTLVQGNQRFASTVEHLQKISEGEKPESMVFPINPVQLGVPWMGGLEPMHAPFAAALGCADARVPIEHIFDCSTSNRCRRRCDIAIDTTRSSNCTCHGRCASHIQVTTTVTLSPAEPS